MCTEPPDTARLLSRRGYITLESYDSDGAPRQTPLSAVEDRGILYARTDPHSNKVKRISGNPHVRVALSDLTGKPKGKWVEGEARVIEGQERAVAVNAFKREYGGLWSLLITLVSRMKGQRLTAVISIRLNPPP